MAGDAAERRAGRWHSLVFIDIPRTRALVNAATRLCPGADVASPHCSVSRPFTLWIHEIEAFVGRLRSELRRCSPFTLQVLEGAAVELDNGHDERRFRALRVAPSLGLQSLVAAVDAALLAYGRQTYFANPVFHITVSTDTPDKSGTEPLDTSLVEEEEQDEDDDDDDDLLFDVTSVICKCGHRYFEIPL